MTITEKILARAQSQMSPDRSGPVIASRSRRPGL